MRISEEFCVKIWISMLSMMANSLGEIAFKWRFHSDVCSLGKFEKAGNGGRGGKVSGKRRT